jgi:hypothetical protein
MVNTGCGPPRVISQDGWVEPAEPEPAAAVPAEAAPPAEEQQQLGRRAERSPRDMVLSLAVLLVPIALVVLFYRLALNGDSPVTIDPAATIQEAQAANVFPVAVPRPGDDWHASSATWSRTSTGATLRIGYVDPDKDPVQLIESSIQPSTLIRAELTGKAEILGSFQAGARSWQRYSGRPVEQALVLFEKGRTIIIVGKTEPKNLDAMASSLS